VVGGALRSSITTGVSCRYAPAPEDAVVWEVEVVR